MIMFDGRLFKLRRVKMLLSVADLAKRTGLHPRTVKRLEDGGWKTRTATLKTALSGLAMDIPTAVARGLISFGD